MASEDVVFNLDGNADNVIAVMDQVIASVDAATKSVDALANALTNLDAVSSALDNIAAGMTSLAAATASATSPFDDLSLSIDLATQYLDTLSTSSDTAAAALDGIPASVDTLVQAFDLASVGADLLATAEGDAAVAADAAAASFNLVAKSAGDAAAGLDLVTGAAVPLATAFTDLIAAAKDATTNIELLGTSAASASTGLDDVSASADNASFSLDKVTSAADAMASAVDAATAALDAMAKSAEAAGIASDTAAAGMQKTSSAANSMATEAEAANAPMKEMNGAGGGDAMMLMMLVPMLLQAGSGFAKMGTSAQDSIAHITGLADPTLGAAGHTKELNAVINQVSDSSIKYGENLDQATNGLYYVMSAGYDTNDSMKILNTSMEAASSTGTQMNDVSSALTSVLHAYNMKASDASTVTNQMVEAVVQGKQDFSEFAKVIGRTAAAGAQAGVSFKEVLAAEATMTQINPSVQRDTQNLSHLFLGLANNTSYYASVAKSLKKPFDENKFAAMGLIEKLQYLSDISGGSGTTAFHKMMKDATSLSVAYDLLNNKSQSYNSILKNIDQSQGALDNAFKQSEGTISASMHHIGAALSVLSYKMVVIATPAVQAAFGAIAKLLEKISVNSQTLVPVMIGLASAFGALLLGAIIAIIAAMSPLILVLGGVAAAAGILGAGIYVLLPRIKAWMDSSDPMAAQLRLLEGALQAIASAIGGAFKTALAATQPLLRDIGVIIRTVVAPALFSFGVGLGQAAALLGQMLLGALEKAAPLIRQFGAWIHTEVVPALQKMSPQINEVAQTLGRFAPFILGAIGAFGIFRPVIGAILPLLTTFGGAFSKAGEMVQLLSKGFFSILPAVERFQPMMKGISTALGGSFKLALSSAKDLITRLTLSFLQAQSPVEFFGNILRMLGGELMGVASDVIAVVAPIAGVIAIVALVVGSMVAWFATTKQGQGALKVLWDAIVGLGKTIMDAMKPAFDSIKQAMKDLGPVFAQLGEALKALWPAFIFFGGVIGVIVVTALGLLIGVIAGVITALGQFIAGIIQVISGIIRIFTGLVQVVGGTFTLIVGLITGNRAKINQGFDMIGKGVLNIWNGLWTTIKGVVQATIGTVLGFISGFSKTVISFFTGLFKTLVGHSIWPDMWKAILSTALTIGNAIVGFLKQFMVLITAPFSIATSWIISIVFSGFMLVFSIIRMVGSMIGLAISIFWSMVVLTTIFYLNLIWLVINGRWLDIFNLIKSIGKKIWDQIGNDWKAIVKTVSDAVGSVWKWISDTWNKIIQFCKDTWDKIVKYLKGVWDSIVKNVGDFVAGVWKWIVDMWNKVVQFFKEGGQKTAQVVGDICADISKHFLELVDKAKEWGSHIIQNLIDGFKSGFSGVQQAVQYVASMFQSVLGHSTPSEGPMANDDQWMPDFMQNLADGINKSRALVKSAAAGVASDIAVTVPTSSSYASAGSTPDSSASTEHIEVLRQILAAIQRQGSSGGGPGSQIGYGIPSTQLGSVNQQFNSTSNFSINDVASMYSQINQLAGLSNEYAGRGAITGVGF